MKRNFGFAMALLAGLVFAGCGKKIGDQCRDNFECNAEDTNRVCDLSQPGGYCTIDFCDEGSCPDDSVCVRFFPRMEYATRPCDIAVAGACAPHEVCVPYAEGGRCVPRATERRNCMQTCEEDGDCRDEYACRRTGGGNAVALTRSAGVEVRYCSPR